MFNKHKRILWLLNHRTLMPYECALIRRLGFEVFVPKVLPEAGFRSGSVDYSHDTSLSIPPRVLERLNGFNFYESTWPSEIVALVNRYFGSAFVMPHGRQLGEAVDNFEGQIVLRAFGLLGTQTYGDVLGTRNMFRGLDVLEAVLVDVIVRLGVEALTRAGQGSSDDTATDDAADNCTELSGGGLRIDPGCFAGDGHRLLERGHAHLDRESLGAAGSENDLCANRAESGEGDQNVVLARSQSYD
jgi:hypothetical protein